MSENEPLPEVDVRQMIRGDADAVLMDACLTFVAMMREKGLTGDVYGPLVVDEWSSALQATAQQSRESLEDYRLGGILAALRPSSPRANFDDSIEQMIEERRVQLRSVGGGENDES